MISPSAMHSETEALSQSVDEAAIEVHVLDFKATVIGPSQVLAELRALYPAVPTMARPGTVSATTVIRVQPNVLNPDVTQILQDGCIDYTVSETGTLAQLEWLITSTAVQHLRSRYLLLHAGAVAHRDRGIILCAQSGCGKSTLTAGLAAAGLTYLSDEIAAIDPDSLEMLPFPRSLCIKQGSKDTLSLMYPQLGTDSPRRRFGDEPVWFLTPPTGQWNSSRITARYLVVPQYIPGARTLLTPLGRSDALQHALAQSFTGSALGERSVGALVALLQRVRCYQLTMGTLTEAVTAVQHLVHADSEDDAPES